MILVQQVVSPGRVTGVWAGRARIRGKDALGEAGKMPALLVYGKGYFLLDALALYDRIDEICWDIAQGFKFAAWPSDFYFVHFGFGAEAEMQSRIVLREVTASAANFAELY
jgi:hypothetical protein